MERGNKGHAKRKQRRVSTTCSASAVLFSSFFTFFTCFLTFSIVSYLIVDVAPEVQTEAALAYRELRSKDQGHHGVRQMSLHFNCFHSLIDGVGVVVVFWFSRVQWIYRGGEGE
jgi:hypothetical protein